MSDKNNIQNSKKKESTKLNNSKNTKKIQKTTSDKKIKTNKTVQRKIFKRRRGTAIIETNNGILLVAGKSRNFITPGGGANLNESRVDAVVREIFEETKLEVIRVKKIFKFVGIVHRTKSSAWQDFHTVTLVKVKSSIPIPSEEVKYIDYYNENSKLKLSPTTKKIIKKYYRWKKSKNFFERFLMNLRYKSKIKK